MQFIKITTALGILLLIFACYFVIAIAQSWQPDDPDFKFRIGGYGFLALLFGSGAYEFLKPKKK